MSTSSKKQRKKLTLADCWLVAVSSPADLARRLSKKKRQITPAMLVALAKDAGNFRLFSITNAGKERPIQEPTRELQWIHARIHTFLSCVEVPTYLHSSVRGKSYITNAAAHDTNMPAIKIDVKKFFSSVTRAAIFNFFHGPMKCRRDVAGLLADLLTFDRRLPTGSAASPVIAFYAFKPMFDEIAEFAESRGLTMSCYVDDMTLSGPRATKAALFEIHKIIARHGLRSHKAHVFSANQPKVVTGVCNTVDGARVPNKLHMNIKAGFDAVAGSPNRDTRDQALRSLLGRLDAAGQIDTSFEARATTLRAENPDFIARLRSSAQKRGRSGPHS